MDLSKLENELGALLGSDGTPDAHEAVTKAMSSQDFLTYAQEQVAKAKAEDEEQAKARLGALKTEVDKVAKFEFKNGELPTVTIFRDPAQKMPTSETQAPKPQSLEPSPTFKSQVEGFGNMLSALLANAPSADSAAPRTEGEAPSAPSAPGAFAWPEDLAKSASDEDIDWGKDSDK